MNQITFSTLACPSWSIETVIARASEYGYDGIEWRGGPQGHIRPNAPAGQKARLRQMSSDAGLTALAVTAYTSFVSGISEERRANVDELRRYSDLAAELGAQHVRAFLGELPTGTKPDTSLYENIADSLKGAAEYAFSVDVRIAIEPHDDFAHSAAVAPVLERTRSQSALGVIWDIGNAFAAGEDPEQSFDLIKDRLAYIQVKDGKGRGSEWQLYSLGHGDVPLEHAVELLLANGYEGALSVEWEYAWHPELDAPEVALPSALRVVRNLLTEVHSKQTSH